MSTNMSRVEQRELSVRLAIDAVGSGRVTGSLLNIAEQIDAYISKGTMPNKRLSLADQPDTETDTRRGA